MKLLSKDAILKRTDLRVEDVDVPEWGGTVRVREMTGSERDQFEMASIVRRGKNREVNLRNLRARLVVMSCVDEKGERLFSNADIEALGKLGAAGIQRVYDKAMELSGLSDADVDELTENFTSDPSGNSTSD